MRPNSESHGGGSPWLSNHWWTTFLLYESREEKMPGKTWNGSLCWTWSLTQKQRGQKSGRATSPSFLAEIEMRSPEASERRIMSVRATRITRCPVLTEAGPPLSSPPC